MSPKKRTAKAPSRKLAKASKAKQVVDDPERVYAFADDVNERATEIATDSKQIEQLETWITFRLSKELFALPVRAIQEILRVGTITRVPHAPFPVRGIINLRGQVLPVIDFRLRLGLAAGEPGPANRILVATSRNRLLGLLVDAVHQVVRLDRNAHEQPPADVMTDFSDYITAVYRHKDDLLILMDMESVLLIPKTLAAS